MDFNCPWCGGHIHKGFPMKLQDLALLYSLISRIEGTVDPDSSADTVWTISAPTLQWQTLIQFVLNFDVTS